ncbi:hypothetical protein V1292_003575 [Bradyrhizobium sp. AZCC 1719]|uniref:hypothetical protein n=1 Tax=Bradyrhizobium sp. AZCC 1719 TaxID=3117028 RepID=UPI002FF3C1B7
MQLRVPKELITFENTLMRALPKGSLSKLGLAAAALLVFLANGSIAQGDSGSCIERASAYVAELDQLLSKERNWITPYKDLEARYAPFLDCEVDTLLEEVLKSRFSGPVTYNPRSKTFFINFSNDDVRVGFVYEVKERRSDYHYALFARK